MLPVAQGSITKLSEGLTKAVTRIVHRREDPKLLNASGAGSICIQTRERESEQAGYFSVQVPEARVKRLAEAPVLYREDVGLDTTRDASFFCTVREDQTNPGDVWLVAKEGKRETRLTTLNPQLAEVEFGETIVVDWKAPSGRDLAGTLLLPAQYTPGTRIPIVTKVRGGAIWSQKSRHFGLPDNEGAPADNLHILACSGYAVFRPDIPMGERDHADDLVEAVVSGVDAVIERGYADPNRLGLLGHSFGGYCVNVLITRTSKFQAAVSGAGICNLTSWYGAVTEAGDDVGIRLLEAGPYKMGATLWEAQDRYLAGSPLFYLDKVETPLLLYHGALDVTCPVAQSEAMFSGLRRLGKETKLLVYKDEEHWPGSWRYPNTVDLWERILAWYDKHLVQDSH